MAGTKENIDRIKRKQDAYIKKIEFNKAYNKANYKAYSVRFNITSEADLIKWLDAVPDKKAYFTRLIILDQKRAARRARRKQNNDKKL